MSGNETINQIAAIRQLHMVQAYQLLGEDGPVMGLLAYYQDKVINLCSADLHFAMLLDKIAKTYDREVESGVIFADDETREFLKKANEFSAEEFERKLSEFEEIRTPLFLPKAFAHCMLLPIVKYVMTMLYESMNDNIVFEDAAPPWFGKGMIEAVTGGKARRYPYRTRIIREGDYEVVVSNVLMTGNSLKMEILLGRDGITVSVRDVLCQNEGSLLLRFEKDGVFLKRNLKNEEKVLLGDEVECELMQEGGPTELAVRLTTGEGTKWKTYLLPWGDQVHEAKRYGKRYRILDARQDGTHVISGFCFQELAKDEASERFGKYAFRLYEREDVTELHLLELEYPGSGRYQDGFAGKYYTKKK